MGDDGYRGYWWHEAQRLNSLAAHHAGNRAMQDVEIGQLRAQLDNVEALCKQVDADPILQGLTDSTYVRAAMAGTWKPGQPHD